MTKSTNNKRIVVRGITFINNDILLIERHRLENGNMLHYYTIPGGGVEENEAFEDAVTRETKEETCVNTKVVKYLTDEDYGDGICHWYYLEYLDGTPELGGEEKEKNSEINHYKVCLINIKDIDNVNILGIGKKLIKECYNHFIKSKQNY